MGESFLSKGKQVEYLFMKLLSKFGEVREAGVHEDIHEHWDVALQTLIDVKGLRKLKRSDEYPNENYHWIELMNVNGKPGWVQGKADVIAFETFDLWVLVEREKLLKFLMVKIENFEEFVDKPTLYKLYRRRGRLDAITLVKTLDLCYLAFCILSKIDIKNDDIKNDGL
jgi:hypothetical protein